MVHLLRGSRSRSMDRRYLGRVDGVILPAAGQVIDYDVTGKAFNTKGYELRPQGCGPCDPRVVELAIDRLPGCGCHGREDQWRFWYPRE